MIPLGLLIHTYFFYPISIWVLSKLKTKNYSKDSNFLPKISILISVYNEEKVIENTIRNFLSSDYDLDKIEFIVGSDNSTDSTNGILKNLSQEIPNLKFYRFEQRRGKPNVLNDLVENATSEILIFSDANTIYKKDAIKKIVQYYVDENVGGVSGKLKLLEHENASQSASQEKIYWDLETLLKQKEGELGILIGANGGIFSIRKKYFQKIPSNYAVMDDFFISLKVLENRKDFLYIEDAVAEEFVAPSLEAEFKRKVRNNSIMMSTIKAIKNLLNPRFGLVSYALWSHKMIRWVTPVLLIILFLSNIFLISYNVFFEYFFYLQTAFFLFGILGFILEKFKLYFMPINLCYYFLMTNVAMFIGIIKFLQNKQTAFWHSTARN